MAEVFQESTRFPDDISFGSSGGPAYSTDVVTVSSGYETRNINWSQARHEYDAAFGIRDQTYLANLIEFFHAVKGKAKAFRFKDWSDYTSSGTDNVSSTDQLLGVGNGSDTEFQLKKTYSYGFVTEREIKKPVTGTVFVSLNDVTQSTGWSVDTTTGIITFDTAPSGGTIIKAGFEFDVPCRLDTDTLSINLEMYQHGTTSVPIVEVRI